MTPKVASIRGSQNNVFQGGTPNRGDHSYVQNLQKGVRNSSNTLDGIDPHKSFMSDKRNTTMMSEKPIGGQQKTMLDT
jgi:hypothetical protein